MCLVLAGRIWGHGMGAGDGGEAKGGPGRYLTDLPGREAEDGAARRKLRENNGDTTNGKKTEYTEGRRRRAGMLRSDEQGYSAITTIEEGVTTPGATDEG